MTGTTVLIADPTSTNRERISRAFAGDDTVYEAASIEDVQAVLEDEPTVLVIGPGMPVERALRFAEDVQAYAPAVGVVMLARRVTTSLLQAGMRAGVRDVLPAATSPKQLREATRRAAAITRQTNAGRNGDQAPPAGKIICVFSSKGGTGKSFISSNLAVLLGEITRQEVALVDLDLESGDLAIMLKLAPTKTMYDAASSIDLLDGRALEGYLTPYRSGVRLLGAPVEPGVAEKISPEAVRRILRMLRTSFRHVVVDGPSFFTDHVLAALDESDECILVASLDVPSIKNLKMALRSLDLLGFDRDRLRIVINRAGSKVGLDVKEVEKAIGFKIQNEIPSSRDVPLCVNRGVPVALELKRSPVTAALHKIAEAVDARQRREPEPARRFRIFRKADR